MKVHGITRAVEDFNRYHGMAIIWQSTVSNEVFTRTYTSHDDIASDMNRGFICLEIKGCGGKQGRNSVVSVQRVENDIRAFSVGTSRYDYSI